MSLIKAFSDSVKGVVSDQWLDVITAWKFDERTVVTPGVSKNSIVATAEKGIISSGSKVHVPENTAAVIFSESAIEEVLTEPGTYDFIAGEKSVFHDGLVNDVVDQIADRFKYGGQSPVQRMIAFVNLREIRNIKYGTRGPQLYHDKLYDTDLDFYSYGMFSVRVIDPIRFIKNFVPANTVYYSFDNPKVREQIVGEFLQSYSVALNKISNEYRLPELVAHANEIARFVKEDNNNAGSWPARFGFEIVSVAIENIEFSENSKRLIDHYSSNKMGIKAYENVSKAAADIAYQQNVSEGIRDNGFGDSGGMVLGMATAATFGVNNATISFDDQIAMVKSLKELLDAGALTQEEFDKKKKEIMGV